MARIENLSVTVLIPGPLPIRLLAHYDAIVDGADGEIEVKIDMGYIEFFLCDKHMADLEGRGEVPEAMRKMVMDAIPEIPRESLVEALREESDWSAHEREHAAGRV